MEENQEAVAEESIQTAAEPRQKTVWQSDLLGFLLYPVIAYELTLQPGSFNIPFGAVESEPWPAPAGMVNRANDDWAAWVLVEDHRRDALYYVKEPATGEKQAVLELYRMGAVIEIDGQTESYDGGGPIPTWLTATPPEPTSQEAALQLT